MNKTKIHPKRSLPKISRTRRSLLQTTAYDPFKYPADFEQTLRHAQATRITYEIKDKKALCPCCSLPIKNEMIPMKCDPSTLAYLGRTIPAYFSLIKMCVLLLLIQFFVSSFFNFYINIYIVWGVRLLKRWLYQRNPQQSLLIQQDLNNLYEGHPVDMALRYANVLKLMFFTAAVSPLMPIELPLSVLGLFILYWVDKYLLLRRYTCKTYLDQQLANSMLDILPYYTVFFSIGNLIICFQYQVTDKFSFSTDTSLYLALVGIVIAIIYKYVFKFKFFKHLYFILFKIETPHKIITKCYDEQKHKFQTTYAQFYPANEANPL